MNKKLAFRLSGIALALAGLWLAWSQAKPQPLSIEKITPNLWVISSNNSGNVAVMPTSEGVLLVDDKFEEDSAEVLAKVKSVSDKPIKYILNTHQHADHTGGNAMMLMKTPADILIQKNARANMVAGKQPGLPQITYGDEAQVFIGGKEVSAHYYGRGHTNGDALILFPSERVLHAGDLYINGGAPLIDYTAKGTILEWDKTLERALQLDFDIVIPGHGPVAKKADLEKWVKNLSTFRAHVKAACAGGAADAIKRLSPADIGTTPAEFLSRMSMPGLCQELAK
jgi:cyclase